MSAIDRHTGGEALRESARDVADRPDAELPARAEAAGGDAPTGAESGAEGAGGSGGLGVIRRLIRSRRDLERTWQVIRKASRFLHQSTIPRMAAALSYRTIFGLVPTLVIGVAVLGSFASQQAMESTVRQLLAYTGISGIVINEEVARQAERDAMLPVGPMVFGPRAPEAAGPGMAPTGESPERAAPEAGAVTTTPGLEDWISTMVTRVRSISFSAIGAIGVLTLIYAAISMLIEIERAFNDIYRAPIGRAWGRRVQLYWTMLTLGIILILATFFVGARATAWLAGLTPALGPGTGLGTLLTFIATVFTSTILLLAVYLWVPNTRVEYRPAIAGAFVGALLWETSKLGLQRYIELSTSYAKLYGSLGLLPLLLIWVYVTWLIVLFGLQVAYALQHFHTWRAEDEARDTAPSIVEPASILAVAAEIAKGFLAGRPTRITDLGARASLDERVAGLMVDRMVVSGIVLRVEQREDSVTLGRPAESVSMAELLKMGHDLSGPVPAVAADLREKALLALEGRTLAGALGRAEPGPVLSPGAGAGSRDGGSEATRPEPGTGAIDAGG